MVRAKAVRFRPVTYRAWRAKRVGSLVGAAVLLLGGLLLTGLVVWYWRFTLSRPGRDAVDVLLGAVLGAMALELLVVPATTGAASLRAVRAGRDPAALAAAGRFARTGFRLSAAAMAVVVAVDVVAVAWAFADGGDAAGVLFPVMGQLPVGALLLSLPASEAGEIGSTDRITDLSAP